MDLTLTAETGRVTGSRPARRLRADGRVPGVVYGLNREPVSVVVPWSELRRVLTTEAGMNALIDLEIDGHHDLTIVKELQRDPVRRTVSHVDFLRIDRDAPISVEVPVVLVGEAHEVEINQGIVEQLLYALLITSKPSAIPTQLEADISALEIGGAVRVRDLTLPEGVTTDVDEDEQIAIGSITRAAQEEEPVAEAEGEAAEGAAAEAAPEGGGGAEASGAGEAE
ncbi:MAG TPA: 50S ribosomal protein L25 [Acidimicrobiales bacterium]|nr:50S ribosomal protein L25 [Acidimicrobiales bacterium]